MWWEAKGAWQQAEGLYSDLIADNPSDSVRLLLPSLKASVPFVQCFCVVSEAKKGRQTVKEDEFFRVLQ
jgi:hypothetical protein